MVTKRHSPAQLTIDWRTLAIGLAILSVGSLTTLVVIVSVQDVDVLSAIALALAVIAFAAQIIVSLGQSFATNKQLATSEAVNSETRSLLGRITIQSDSLLSNQTQQFDRVLNAALGNDAVREAVAAVTGGDDDGDISSGLDTEALTQALRIGAERNLGVPLASDLPHQDFVNEMSGFPTQAEAQEAIAVFKTLTTMEAVLLVRRAAKDIQRAEFGFEPKGYSASGHGKATDGLIAKGLVVYRAEADARGAIRDYRRLTPLGRTLARLLNVGEASDRPDWIGEALDD
jgi:hypothetical protein